MNLDETCQTFADASYRRHADHWDQIVKSQDWQRLIGSWFDESTADFWRHRRMYEAAAHLARFGVGKWLTIGDGQFGLDSVRLQKRGVSAALPTDIAEATLREAKSRGIIREYSVENAERMSFKDDSFDFVFCKEAYHHFPRPYLALYEMLRVAKKGVVLVEPQDQMGSIVKAVLYRAKRALNRQRHFDEKRYEDSGNYIYSVSRREMTKVCLGINLPCIAFKGLSDFYIPGVEFEPASYSSLKYLSMRAGVWANDVLTTLRLSKHNVLMSCIFKMEPPVDVRADFRRNGWQFVELPRNPYAGDSLPLPRPPMQ
jgi:ubiquinone/menaquinone biosynthesis C-methylase UbiE